MTNPMPKTGSNTGQEKNTNNERTPQDANKHQAANTGTGSKSSASNSNANDGSTKGGSSK